MARGERGYFSGRNMLPHSGLLEPCIREGLAVCTLFTACRVLNFRGTGQVPWRPAPQFERYREKTGHKRRTNLSRPKKSTIRIKEHTAVSALPSTTPGASNIGGHFRCHIFHHRGRRVNRHVRLGCRVCGRAMSPTETAARVVTPHRGHGPLLHTGLRLNLTRILHKFA